MTRCVNGEHRIEPATQICIDCQSPVAALCFGRSRAVHPPGEEPYMVELIDFAADPRGHDATPLRIIETHLRGEDLR